jgi:hypothetical protein
VSTPVIHDRLLFHYLLGDSRPQPVLRPLSDFPDSERWQAIQRAVPGHYEALYRAWAEPVLLRPYQNSGVFLTPIDFRRVPGTILTDRPRVSVPVDAVDPEWAVLTYEWRGERVSRRLSREALADAAALWGVEDIRRWFGRDPQRLFFYVPQVVTYQPGGVVVPEIPESGQDA